MTAHDEPMPDDRRHTDRRIDDLERKHAQLANAIQRIEIEQVNAKDVLKSRFDALNNGQQTLATKMDGFKDFLTASIGEPTSSPAGRAIMKELERISSECGTRWEQLDSLIVDQSKVRGAVQLIHWIGLGGLGAVALALLKAFGVVFHGGTP